MKNKYLLHAALALYVISVALPGIEVSSVERGAAYTNLYYGYQVLLMGWVGLIFGMFGWYGNVFFFYALAQAKRPAPKNPLLFSCLALLIGSIDFLFYQIVRLFTGGKHPMIDHFGIGYYVWIVSLALLVAYTYRQKSETAAMTTPPADKTATV